MKARYSKTKSNNLFPGLMHCQQLSGEPQGCIEAGKPQEESQGSPNWSDDARWAKQWNSCFYPRLQSRVIQHELALISPWSRYWPDSHRGFDSFLGTGCRANRVLLEACWHFHLWCSFYKIFCGLWRFVSVGSVQCVNELISPWQTVQFWGFAFFSNKNMESSAGK